MCYTGINQQTSADKEIRISPNPSNSIFEISNSDYVSKIILFDALSHKIVEKTINLKSFLIDLSTYAAGVYYVQIQMKNSISVRKLLLIR